MTTARSARIDGFRPQVVRELAAAWPTLQRELLSLRQDEFVRWMDRQAYGGDWWVFPLVWDVAEVPREFDLANNLRRCPGTAALLARFPRIRGAGVSRLMPGCHVREHEDRPKAGVLRIHVGLSDAPRSSLVLGATRVPAVAGEIVIFDHSMPHAAHNDGDLPRDLLLVDYELDAAEIAEVTALRGAVHFGASAARACQDPSQQVS